MNTSQLSRQKQRFVELMQQIGFGRIEQLVIRGGEPVLDPAPRIVREFKFGSERRVAIRAASTDFELKSQIRELFDLFSEIGDSAIDVLVLKHGLPFQVTINELISGGDKY